MILCLGPNPALDRSLGVDALVPGAVHRPDWSVDQAGGKALNVARVLHRLGADVHALSPGNAELQRLAAEEGLPASFTPAQLGVRTCTTIVEASGRSTDLYEAGRLAVRDWEAWLLAVEEHSRRASIVALSGSFPHIVDGPDPGPAIGSLLSRLEPSCELWVDTSGPPLEALLGDRSAGPALTGLKVNRDEANGAVGDGTWAEVTERLAERSGAEIVVVTDGPAGALARRGARSLRGRLPATSVVGPTGSGDAFLAGLVAARRERANLSGSLALSLGCAVANLEARTAGAIDPERARFLGTVAEVGQPA